MSIDRLDPARLTAARDHAFENRMEIEASENYGCFYCRKFGPTSEISEWVDDGDTATCPHCGIDSVIGSASGYPVTKEAFLGAMKRRWF